MEYYKKEQITFSELHRKLERGWLKKIPLNTLQFRLGVMSRLGEIRHCCRSTYAHRDYLFPIERPDFNDPISFDKLPLKHPPLPPRTAEEEAELKELLS